MIWSGCCSFVNWEILRDFMFSQSSQSTQRDAFILTFLRGKNQNTAKPLRGSGVE
jgi:hypothetical protein